MHLRISYPSYHIIYQSYVDAIIFPSFTVGSLFLHWCDLLLPCWKESRLMSIPLNRTISWSRFGSLTSGLRYTLASSILSVLYNFGVHFVNSTRLGRQESMSPSQKSLGSMSLVRCRLRAFKDFQAIDGKVGQDARSVTTSNPSRFVHLLLMSMSSPVEISSPEDILILRNLVPLLIHSLIANLASCCEALMLMLLPLQREESEEILLNLFDILLMTLRMKLWLQLFPCSPSEAASSMIIRMSSSGSEFMLVTFEVDGISSMIEIMAGFNLYSICGKEV